MKGAGARAWGRGLARGAGLSGGGLPCARVASGSRSSCRTNASSRGSSGVQTTFSSPTSSATAPASGPFHGSPASESPPPPQHAHLPRLTRARSQGTGPAPPPSQVVDLHGGELGSCGVPPGLAGVAAGLFGVGSGLFGGAVGLDGGPGAGGCGGDVDGEVGPVRGVHRVRRSGGYGLAPLIRGGRVAGPCARGPKRGWAPCGAWPWCWGGGTVRALWAEQFW